MTLSESPYLVDSSSVSDTSKAGNGTAGEPCHKRCGSGPHYNNNVATDYDKYKAKHPGAKLIGIDGKWYDVTAFIDKHPGGPVIEQFLGKDATPVFRGFHERDVLKYRTPVGSYERNMNHPAAKAFADLHTFFLEHGFFQTSLSWYAMKFSVSLILITLVHVLVMGCTAWYWHFLATIFLAAFWQQCGFFMHDFMHNHFTHKRRIDQKLGTFFGTLCFGVSASWWRDEHFIHHALTNTLDVLTNFRDPQMTEPVWAQNKKLFPFYKTKIQQLAIRLQHITFIPLCVCAGRVGIIVDSFKQEKRPSEWLAFALHWCWMVHLLSYLPSWQAVFLFYLGASILEGVLHIQLLLSHYAKPWYELPQVCDTTDWYHMQVECNINIVTPLWLDWFHGGLNFHIEHHLYPTMPRHNYRAASKHIKRVCQDLGLRYDECGWFEAVSKTLQCLKKMSKHFTLDPR